jgi:diadenosine tetraphosphate (Ap4A) HIT family hydrolase
MKCPFCDEDNVSRHKIYETATEYVVYSIRPANKGQCLVVPKRHVVSVSGLGEEEAGSLFRTVRHVSRILKDYLEPDGFNYGLNEGKIAGQTIDHLHFHIMPRFAGDVLPGFHIFHRDPARKQDLSPAEMDTSVSEFRKVFQDFKPV